MGGIFNFGNEKTVTPKKEKKCKTLSNGTRVYWPEGFRLTTSREKCFEEIAVHFGRVFRRRVTAIFMNQDEKDHNHLKGINFSFEER